MIRFLVKLIYYQSYLYCDQKIIKDDTKISLIIWHIVHICCFNIYNDSKNRGKHLNPITCTYFELIFFVLILNRDSTLTIQIPTARLSDGDEIHPLSVTLPKGRVIRGSPDGINTELICQLSFKSSKPVSFIANVLFCDSRDKW